MRNVHTVVRIGAVSALLTAGLASGIGTAAAQADTTPATSGETVAQGRCFDTDPAHPGTINPLACLAGLLSGSGSSK